MAPEQNDLRKLLKRIEMLNETLEAVLRRLHRLEVKMGITPSPRPTVPPSERTPEALPPQPFEEPPPKEPAVVHEALEPTEPIEEPVMAAPPPPVEPVQEPPSRPSKVVEWETLVGGKWALWVGVVLVLFAASFGIAYGWRFLGPAGRVSVGIFVGLLFLAGGEWAKGRGARWFHQGVTAGGVALLYLSIWAAAMHFGLIGSTVAFLGMTVVTAAAVALSVRYDARSLIFLAVLGGFLIPVLLRDSGAGSRHITIFFGYVTLLNAGILVTGVFKRWREVNLLVFFATLILLEGWFYSSYSPDMLWAAFTFLTLNFLVFVGIGSIYPLRFRVPAGAADLLFIFGVAVAYFSAGAALLSPLPRYASAGFCLILAALYFALGWASAKRMPDNRGMVLSGFGLSVAFLTLAPPMVARGHPLAMAWAAEAATLAVVAFAINRRELKRTAITVWLLSAATTAWVDIAAGATYGMPVLNARFVTFAIVIAAGIYMTYLYLRREQEKETARRTASMLTFFVGVLVFWIVGREIYGLFFQHRWFDPQWSQTAWMFILALWALVATGLCTFGFVKRLEAPQSLGGLSLPLIAVALISLGVESLTYDWMPLVNPRLLSALVVAAAMAGIVMIPRRFATSTEPQYGRFFTGACSLLVFFALSEEVYAAFGSSHFLPVSTSGLAAWFCIVALWAVGAGANILLGFRWRRPELRLVGAFMFGLAAAAALRLSLSSEVTKWYPFFNFRLLAFAVLIVVAAVAGSELRRRAVALSEMERKVLTAALFRITANVLALWVLTQETYRLFEWWQFPNVQAWRYAAHLGVSLAWTLYAAASLVMGMARRIREARWLALVLFGLAVLKVFLWDLGFLTLPFRMLSFGILGLILIIVAWLYSRYGKHLLEWAKSD